MIASNIDVHSDFNITQPPTNGNPVPLPPIVAAGSALLGCIGFARRPRRIV
jgi:hypothetical protein